MKTTHVYKNSITVTRMRGRVRGREGLGRTEEREEDQEGRWREGREKQTEEMREVST